MSSAFGDMLMFLREQHGVTRAEMGSVCKIHRETIRIYEKGTILPSNGSLEQMLDVLPIDQDEKQRVREALLTERKRKIEKEFKGTLLTPERLDELMLEKLPKLLTVVTDLVPGGKDLGKRAAIEQRLRNILLERDPDDGT